VVGFERSRYLVREKRRWTELCVIVSVPTDGFISDVTFNLTVEHAATFLKILHDFLLYGVVCLCVCVMHTG